jgi:hypothetical protein
VRDAELKWLSVPFQPFSQRRRKDMTRKGVLLALAIAFVTLLAGHVIAGELTDPAEVSLESALEAQDRFVSCTGWLNCSPASPNYTGICCRSCTDERGKKGWDCKRQLAIGEKPAVSFAGPVPAGEATVTGIVTHEGFLMAYDGQEYVLTGDQSERLQRNMGKEIEVKGTVKEKQGKVTIDVEAYELMLFGDAREGGASKARDAFVSCGAWENCSPLPPTFTGTCCRQCNNKEGAELWDCQVTSAGEYFNLAEW